MKTVIVLIPVSYTNARKACEYIENTTFKDQSELNMSISSQLESDEEREDEENENILYFDISDFMDEVNNQNLDVLTEFFISYVTIKN